MASFEKGTCVPCILVFVWLVLIPSIIIFTWIVQCIQYCIRKKTMNTQSEIVTSNRTGESVFETERPNLSSYTHTRSNNNTKPTISSPTTDHFSLQRQATLPSYDNVTRQQQIEEQSESPPPRYDEIV